MILKKKVEKKCNKNGFVDEVYKIVEFEDGEMYPENLSGSVMFDVKYHCKLCIPIENTIIIAKVVIINQELIIVTNGPLFIFIPKDNIDNNIWNISDNDLVSKKTNNKLKVNDFVKVTIANKKINKDDWQIKAIGVLNGIADKKEIEKYYGHIEELEDKDDDIDKENDDNFII